MIRSVLLRWPSDVKNTWVKISVTTESFLSSALTLKDYLYSDNLSSSGRDLEQMEENRWTSEIPTHHLLQLFTAEVKRWLCVLQLTCHGFQMTLCSGFHPPCSHLNLLTLRGSVSFSHWKMAFDTQDRFFHLLRDSFTHSFTQEVSQIWL